MNTVALEPIEQLERAELLMNPLRQRILAEALEPSTAAEIARRVDLPPQKVNYHVRALADAGFLKPAGEGLKRNLVEKRYRASARSYLLLPRVLGEMRADVARDPDRLSAGYLLHLTAVLQEELAHWLDPEVGGSGEVPTLSLESELRFDSAEQRAAFAGALQDAVTDVIGRFSQPARGEEGESRPGQPFRLVLGCYPVPPRSRGHDEPMNETTTEATR